MASGWKHTPEMISRFKKERSGENHWNWKGGIASGENRREYNRLYNKKKREEDGERILFRERRSRYRKKFGVTDEFIFGLYRKTKGKCSICGVPENECSRSLHIDHCHKTNKIRGLLCSRCNSGIGLFLEDVGILKNAIKYIKEN